MMPKALALYAQLEAAAWFSAVGQSLQAEDVKVIQSWEEAAEWCASPISWWANVEGKKRLYEHLASCHYDQFITWNNVARSLLPPVTDLLQSKILTRMPAAVASGKVRDWIQSQLISALLEMHYADFAEVRLFCKQIEYYLEGHFPCGWCVNAPEDFPHHSVVVIY